MALTSNEWIAAIKEQMLALQVAIATSARTGVPLTEEEMVMPDTIAKNCDTALEVLIAEQNP